jgi:TonB family protein
VSGTDSSLARSTAQLLTDAVSQRWSVPTVDGRDLLGRWAAERRSVAAPLADNAAFAYGLGANQMVIGSVVAAGGALRISLDVYDTHDLGHLARGAVTGSRDSLFALVDRLAPSVATALCTQPEFNQGHLCYDAPARPQEALTVTDVPQPGEVVPTAPSFFVRVDSAGGVADVRVRTPSNHDDVTAFALAAVRQASYVPARKNGRPVDAWATVPVAVRTGAPGAAVAQNAACANPGYNAHHACFDVRPAPLAAPTAPWSGSGQPPTPATFWVRVSATGDVAAVRPLATSSDDRFSEAALAAAQALRFNPAMKDGRPVEAWTQIAVMPGQ